VGGVGGVGGVGEMTSPLRDERRCPDTMDVISNYGTT